MSLLAAIREIEQRNKTNRSNTLPPEPPRSDDQLEQYLQDGARELAKPHPSQAAVYAYLSCVLNQLDELKEQLKKAKQELNRQVSRLAVNNARLAAEGKFEQIIDSASIKRKYLTEVINPLSQLMIQVSGRVLPFLRQVNQQYPKDQQLKAKLLQLSLFLAIEDDDYLLSD